MPEGKKRKMGDNEERERNTEYDRTERHKVRREVAEYFSMVVFELHPAI